MKTKSAKSKGRALQNWVKEYFCKAFYLGTDKIRCAIMGEKGTDLVFDSSIATYFPYSIECKNQESLNIWKAWEQTVDNTKEHTFPLLFIKKNRQEPLVVMSANLYFELEILARRQEL